MCHWNLVHSYSFQRAAENELQRGPTHVPDLGEGLSLPPESEWRAYSDVIKDLYRGRLFLIIQVGPKSNHKLSSWERGGFGKHRRGGPVTSEAETGAIMATNQGMSTATRFF